MRSAYNFEADKRGKRSSEIDEADVRRFKSGARNQRYLPLTQGKLSPPLHVI
jgi:hypothetical protein